MKRFSVMLAALVWLLVFFITAKGNIGIENAIVWSTIWGISVFTMSSIFLYDGIKKITDNENSKKPKRKVNNG